MGTSTGSTASTTHTPSVSAAAGSSASTRKTGKTGGAKGSLHPNEVLFKHKLEEAHQLVQAAGWKLVEPAVTADELQQFLQAAGVKRKLLSTLDSAGIPNPRKQRYLNEAAGQGIALQTLEDILRLQVQNLRSQEQAGVSAASQPLPAAIVTTVAGLVAASSAAVSTSAPPPYAAATAAALAAAATSSGPLSGTQGRLLSLAGGGGGAIPGGGGASATTATPTPAPAVVAGGVSTAAPRITPTTVVGPAFVGAMSTVSSLPSALPSLGTASAFGGSTPSLPQVVPGAVLPAAAAGIAGGPLGGASASAPAGGGGGMPLLPWSPVPGELQEGNQFTTTCSQGPAYYLSFPPPWNMLPPSEDSHLNTMLKITPQALPKFSGDRRGYLNWRNTFLPCVHLTNIDVRFKAMLLRSSLEPTSARMREFIESIPSTGPGYRYAVTELENRYGRQEAVLMARQDALLALPQEKEGDFRTLETMQSRLGSFLVEWTNVAGTPITESESLAFYTMLMGKVDSLYTLKYLAWLQQFGLRKGVQSLYQWLATELKNHRTAETFARQRLRGTFVPTNKQYGAAAAAARPAQQYHHVGWKGGAEEEAEAAGEEMTEEGKELALLLRGRARGRVPRRPPCSLCKEDHCLGRCKKFIAMTPSERKATLTKERRCYLCFQKGHSVGRCICTFTCAHCKQKHHTMIHGAEEAKDTLLYSQEDHEADLEDATETLEFGLKAAVRDELVRVSLRTLPILLVNPANGKRKRVNAHLDDGCTTAALVSEGVAAELGLAGPSTWTSTEGVGGKITKYQTILTVVEVCSLVSPFRRALSAQVMGKPAGTY